MIQVGAQVIDVDRVITGIEKLGNISKNRHVRRGLNDAAQVFIRGGKARLRTRLLYHGSTGSLLRSFERRLKRAKPGALAGFHRGQRGDDRNGYHAHLVDKGTVRRKTRRGYNRGIMPANLFWADTLQQESARASDVVIRSLEAAIYSIEHG